MSCINSGAFSGPKGEDSGVARRAGAEFNFLNPSPPVKTLLLSSLVVSMSVLSGCASRPAEARATDLNQPGPAIGHAVGSVGGAVTGQVAGAIAAGAQGAADAVKAPFNNERRVIRRWRTETTADGRTIQVPYEVVVDANGHVIEERKAQ